MAKTPPTVLKIDSPSDFITTVPRMLGFVPSDSIVVICAGGERTRLGLVLRYGFEMVGDPDMFAYDVERRVRHEGAESYFILVYADDRPLDDDYLPYAEVVDRIRARLRDLEDGSWLVVGDDYWSYCPDPKCCRPGPRPISRDTPGAVATAAAYAMRGRGVLPSRQAVADTVAYDGDDTDAATMATWIDAARLRWDGTPQIDRGDAMRSLIVRLSNCSTDPHYRLDDGDVAELVALSEDVVVRDEILVRAAKPRRREPLQRLLTSVVRRVPPPDAAPLCSALAWVAYSNGQGVIANVALDRAFLSDPDYSLAHLIADGLDRQIPPSMLEQVMQGAARDLKRGRRRG